MKNLILLFSCFNLLICHGNTKKGRTKELEEQLNKQGISFTENKGQVVDQNYKARPDVLFSGTDGNLVFHLKTNGISYQLNRVDSWKEVNDERTKEKRKQIGKSTIYRLDINWLNANTSAQVTKGKALEGYNNYYLESCPNGALNVQSFEEVTYQKIYNGIDLKWFQKDGHLKYDYIVAAGADYKHIQLEIKGTEKISLNSKGELILKTPLGDIIEQAPLVLQNNKTLKSKWIIKKNILSFDIENVNPNLELIIDPVVRVWGTYYGGSLQDWGYAGTADASGNVYLAGETISNSSTLIATVGAHQITYGGASDAFLVMFNGSGVRQWATYYGGSGIDRANACVTDAVGNVYLAGASDSNIGTSIATSSSHQSLNGGGLDAFLVKFDATGLRLWGSYYGGSGNDQGFSCSTDATGNVYLAGRALSGTGTVIATALAHQATYAGGDDAFLVKFSANGVRQWGTYYGGAGTEDAQSCTTDASGNVFLAGYTSSNTGTIIATAGSHQSFNANDDAFLVKFNASGIRQWGTYYGGASVDYGRSCVTDAGGNVYLAGYTGSATTTLIATVGAHQSAQAGGGDDAFLVKFNASGVRQWGTYYGGSGYDQGFSSSIDANGNVYLAGMTNSNTGTAIATTGAFQTTLGGSYDAFLVKFNSSGLRKWGTYYGGSSADAGHSCTADATGNVSFAGYTQSNTGTVIASAGAHQIIYGGGNTDAFLVKILDCVEPTNPSGSNVMGCANSTSTLTATSGASTINWYATPSSTTVVGTGTAYITPTLGIGTYTYYAEAFTCTLSPSRTAITLTVNALPPVTATSNPTLICVGQSATLTASGATSYTWSAGGTGTIIAVSPTVTSTYTVTGIDANGCQNVASITQSVSTCTGIDEKSNKLALIEIYPNPTNDVLNINLGGLDLTTVKIEVMNSIGQVVLSSDAKSNEVKLNLSLLSSGMYMVKVALNSKETISQKLIKN